MNIEIDTYVPNCKLSFDALDENFPHLIQRKKDPADAIYGRVLTYPTEGSPVIECYQYILFWKLQKLPKHEFDYGPLFVYRMKDQNIIVYDKGHYVVERRHVAPFEFVSLKVKNPWHSFKSTIDAKVAENESHMIIPLSDEIITGWWNEEGRKRFKIIRNLIDPLRLFGFHDFDDPPFSFLDLFAKEMASTPPTIRRDVSRSKEGFFAHHLASWDWGPLPHHPISEVLEKIQLRPEVASTKFLLHLESSDREELISAWDNVRISEVDNTAFDGE